MSGRFAFIAVAGLLAACQSMTLATVTRTDVPAAEQRAVAGAIAYGMRDPASAQFRNWEGYNISDGSRVVCVEVNGRNGFGGLTGFEQTFYRTLNGALIYNVTGDLGAASCNNARTGNFYIAAPSGTA